MKNKLFILVVLMLAVSLSLLGCGNESASGPVENEGDGTATEEGGEQSVEGVIKIGAVLPMTGPAAVFGEKFQNAYTMAVEEINEAGGVRGGMKLELVIEDSQERPEEGVKSAERLINDDDVLILTGGRSSGVTFAVARVANQYQMPYLIDHGSTDLATQSGWEYVFRFNPTAGMYSEALQDFLINETDVSSVAYIQVDNAFGDAIYEYGLKDFFEEKGYDVLYEKYDENSLDLRPIMNNVKNFGPDAVIMTSGTDNEATQIMRAAAEAGVNAKVFAGTGAGHSIMGFYEQAGDLAEYVMSSAPWHGDKSQDEWHEFYNNYRDRYGHSPGEHEVEGYVSIYIIADVLERAESLNREDVRKALAETDMMTIFGPIKFEDFDGYTNQNRGITELSQWIDGELVSVYPEEVADREPVYPFPSWNER
ncbi:branched-chain amino acid transport system substrate-binding protein [Caldalkalibacillus uzonensis]|uniref:Branched-chain amino acid transport system substrate-binding protein n=1 Tax=Caldalkalibacillus uzonensis TaxID=353224 RepID=A0ABU0CP21_9BACI|nr:ABC transporter substrate-binding protein [Caldalkalibacillus uzonensis]MDQ0338144.1 branched-chain amino acid transport system substrate-binding protein [Caldalkalibacillus uzonensis]